MIEMKKGPKQPDWKAAFLAMANTKYSGATLLAEFEKELARMIASRTVDDTLPYRQPLKR